MNETNTTREQIQTAQRRQFLTRTGAGMGAAALNCLTTPALFGSGHGGPDDSSIATTAGPQFPGKAKRIIYLFMCGGPSQIDTFDYKPELEKLHGTELPASIRGTQRITGMTAGQTTFPVVKAQWKYQQHGQCGAWVSDAFPQMASIVDELAIIKTVNTEAINHDPGITFINTGNQQPGKPSMGAWLSYGLGSENENMPAYVVMISRGRGNLQALYSRLWGSGFLPAKHQGVKLRSSGEPVLFLANPEGISRTDRRQMLDGLAELNQLHFDNFGDRQTQARISQYEMAFRMQTAAPEILDFADEPQSTFDLYGEQSKKPGTFAANCLRARRLAESGVRFIQLFHRGWDQHNNLKKNLGMQAEDVDRASAALVTDLKQRGMLDETLVIWGGEFGRTVYSQGNIDKPSAGRDHHGRCFSMWMAGAGIKGGTEYGKTDEFSYNILENPVHIRDLNATILHTMGVDHNRLQFKYQGLDQTLTGVEPARVVKELFV